MTTLNKQRLTSIERYILPQWMANPRPAISWSHFESDHLNPSQAPLSPCSELESIIEGWSVLFTDLVTKISYHGWKKHNSPIQSTSTSTSAFVMTSHSKTIEKEERINGHGRTHIEKMRRSPVCMSNSGDASNRRQEYMRTQIVWSHSRWSGFGLWWEELASFAHRPRCWMSQFVTWTDHDNFGFVLAFDGQISMDEGTRHRFPKNQMSFP
jgi:hypothetical protein